MTPRGLVFVADSAHAGNDSKWTRGRVPALERVANRPIFDHVLDSLSSAGIADVVVVAAEEAIGDVRESITLTGADRARSLELLPGRGRLTFERALRLAAPLVGAAPCVAHVASGLLDEPLHNFTGDLDDDPSEVVLLAHHSSVPGKPINLAASSVHASETGAWHGALDRAGVLLLGGGALQSIVDPVDSSLRVRFVDGWRHYAGDAADLLELNRIALDRLDLGARAAAEGGNRIEGRVAIDPTASVENSVIVGPAVIGAGARIVEAYIGPYTSVGEDVLIEGVEVERSIISAGASVVHVGGRLVGSVVGAGARIFRDFSLPRAIRLRVGAGDEIALC
jgi:glucose-1-phosphate thymidylyltransferase